jgi:predicted RNA-binding protein Jag
MNLEELIDSLETLLTEANQAQKEYEMIGLTAQETRGKAYIRVRSAASESNAKITESFIDALIAMDGEVLESEESLINARFAWHEAQSRVEVQRERIKAKRLIMQQETTFKGMY